MAGTNADDSPDDSETHTDGLGVCSDLLVVVCECVPLLPDIPPGSCG